jgi:ribonuclease-3
MFRRIRNAVSIEPRKSNPVKLYDIEMEQTRFSELEAALGHSFQDGRVLVRALTHSSLAYERALDKGTEVCTDNSSDADNEQLEFLGDAVVGLLVADWLYSNFPELKEGELSRLRAYLVSRKHLGQVASSLDLGHAMRLGRGEERSGGRKKAALQANCIEAVIGALYLDGGLEAARRFVEKHIVAPFAMELRTRLGEDGNIGDHKTALQEHLQATKSGVPQYVVKAESGPDHRKRFLVEVRLAASSAQPRMLARGIGPTKKKAEQEAARRAYERLVHPRNSFAIADKTIEDALPDRTREDQTQTDQVLQP